MKVSTNVSYTKSNGVTSMIQACVSGCVGVAMPAMEVRVGTFMELVTNNKVLIECNLQVNKLFKLL